MFSYIIILLTICTSCNNISTGISSNALISNKDSIPPINEIYGIYKMPNNDNPVFEIKQDSIFYIDNEITYYYKIQQDSIHIYFDDWIYRAKYSFSHDTLIFVEKDEKKIYIQ